MRVVRSDLLSLNTILILSGDISHTFPTSKCASSFPTILHCSPSARRLHHFSAFWVTNNLCILLVSIVYGRGRRGSGWGPLDSSAFSASSRDPAGPLLTLSLSQCLLPSILSLKAQCLLDTDTPPSLPPLKGLVAWYPITSCLMMPHISINDDMYLLSLACLSCLCHQRISLNLSTSYLAAAAR